MRAPARRPRVVLVDVLGTMLRMDALGSRFVDIGRPAEEAQLFFARTLRDGMALTLAGDAPPFGDGRPGRAAHRGGPRRCPRMRSSTYWAACASFRRTRDVEPALMAL